MKLLKMISLLLVLALLLCGCGQQAAPEKTEPSDPAVSTPSETPSQPDPADENTTYTVTIQDENGNPIPGAMVQLCMDTCYPGIANDQGVAQFQVPEADYKVSFLSLPEGFTYASDAQEFYFEAGSTEMTIVLKAEA